jgi:hypothetical protein
MYAPVFLPQAPAPSPAVRAFERAALAAEGPHHVAGRYFARSDDAERFEREAARHVAADRVAQRADRVMGRAA